MKKVSNGWLIFQVIQMAIILGIAFFALVMGVDVIGEVETPKEKMHNFKIWGICCLAVVVLEWLIYFIAQRTGKK